ncbi:MAG: TRAP transporter small permease [Gammaproteobacteria bacterium]|nr:TRAP transporter small permease [Gammaproteobacteria bacterium]
MLQFLNKNLERWLMLGFYLYIVVVVFVEVIRRFVFNYSSIWGEETARYAFVYLVWIGAAAAVTDRAHIRIDVVFSMVPQKAKNWLYVFGDVLMLTFACIAFYYSAESLMSSLKFGSSTFGLRINTAWFTAAVPLGFLLIAIRLIQSIRRDISDIRAGKPVFTGKAMFS